MFDDKDEDWWKKSPDDNDGSRIQVYHESVRIPLFNGNYEVMVGNYMDEMMAHMRTMLGGISLIDRDKYGSIDIPGYSCVLKGNIFPTTFYVFLCLNPDGLSKKWPDISSTIIHEATHLSWYVLDHLQIEVGPENHEIQCYLMQDFVKKITEVVDRAKNKLGSDSGDIL